MQRMPNHARPQCTGSLTNPSALVRLGRQTTPCMPLSTHAERLCRALSPGKVPVLLSFRAIDHRYVSGNCHVNVMHAVRERGGERVFGWVIWEHGVIPFCEGEFHSVWRTPQGELVDVTPRQDGEAKVLFLEDPRRKVERRSGVDVTYRNWGTGSGRKSLGERTTIQRILPLELCLSALGFPPGQPIGVPVQGC